jgi:hypothetical protein
MGEDKSDPYPLSEDGSRLPQTPVASKFLNSRSTQRWRCFRVTVVLNWLQSAHTQLTERTGTVRSVARSR